MQRVQEYGATVPATQPAKPTSAADLISHEEVKIEDTTETTDLDKKD